MVCTPLSLPGGGTGIVCGPAPRLQSCSGCGRPRAELLCDGAVPSRKSGTCDRPVCKGCVTSREGKDYCLDCVTGLLRLDQVEHADVWRRADGTLVLDFCAETLLKASRRKTSNSRGPGQEGVVYSARVQAKRCPDCGVVCDGGVQAGRHAPHGDGSGSIVNCVGQRIQPWP